MIILGGKNVEGTVMTPKIPLSASLTGEIIHMSSVNNLLRFRRILYFQTPRNVASVTRLRGTAEKWSAALSTLQEKSL
jgi:hypothetical protein